MAAADLAGADLAGGAAERTAATGPDAAVAMPGAVAVAVLSASRAPTARATATAPNRSAATNRSAPPRSGHPAIPARRPAGARPACPGRRAVDRRPTRAHGRPPRASGPRPASRLGRATRLRPAGPARGRHESLRTAMPRRDGCGRALAFLLRPGFAARRAGRPQRCRAANASRCDFRVTPPFSWPNCPASRQPPPPESAPSLATAPRSRRPSKIHCGSWRRYAGTSGKQ
jgi:hypothetical protein